MAEVPLFVQPGEGETEPRKWHGAATEEVLDGCWENVLHREGGWVLEQAPQGSSHSNEPARVQVFGQHSQTQGLVFGCSCTEPG